MLHSIDIDLDNNEKERNIRFLETITGSFFMAQAKARIFHWNVVGPNFMELHSFFQDIYEELTEQMDEAAERIRALGGRAPMTVEDLLQNSLLSGSTVASSSKEMILSMGVDYGIIITRMREMLSQMTNSPDEGTKDLLIEHLRASEKRLWMIRSFIGER